MLLYISSSEPWYLSRRVEIELSCLWREIDSAYLRRMMLRVKLSQTRNVFFPLPVLLSSVPKQPIPWETHSKQDFKLLNGLSISMSSLRILMLSSTQNVEKGTHGMPPFFQQIIVGSFKCNLSHLWFQARLGWKECICELAFCTVEICWFVVNS